MDPLDDARYYPQDSLEKRVYHVFLPRFYTVSRLLIEHLASLLFDLPHGCLGLVLGPARHHPQCLLLVAVYSIAYTQGKGGRWSTMNTGRHPFQEDHGAAHQYDSYTAKKYRSVLFV
jgi:hypothetical protein